MKRSFYLLLTIIALCLSRTRTAGAQECSIVNLMPPFWHAVDNSHDTPDQTLHLLHRDLIAPNGDLYSATGVGFSSEEKLNAAILKTIADARTHPAAIHSTLLLLQQQLPTYIRDFKRAFPDFQCNFKIYLLPAFGALDGAGRIVNGNPALLLGIDNIAAEQFSSETLRIFIDHELFHRYHSQVAGFSDDNAQRETLWRALWAEGLATYTSQALNPPASMQDALMFPRDLVQRSQPQLSALIAQLIPQLDEVNPKLFATFFSYHKDDGGVPPRSGYYIGSLTAQRLAQQNSLFGLAHMQAPEVRTKLKQALSDIQQENLSHTVR
jgi:hypothetical protein